VRQLKETDRRNWIISYHCVTTCEAFGLETFAVLGFELSLYSLHNLLHNRVRLVTQFKEPVYCLTGYERMLFCCLIFAVVFAMKKHHYQTRTSVSMFEF